MNRLNTAPNPCTGVRTNDPTLYELAAEHADTGQRILIAYCRSRTRRGLYKALAGRMEHVERVIDTLAIDWDKRAADGGTMGKWHVWFTGRTERDARGGVELPYIADLP